MSNIIQRLLLRGKQISLKATVLSLFFFVTIIITVLLISQLFYFSQKLSYESINTKINTLVNNIQISIKTNNKINTNIVSLLSTDIETSPSFYTNILKNNPSLYSVYKGYKDGSFYEIINLDIHNSLREIYKASLKDKWLLIKVKGSMQDKREVTLLNSDLNITSVKIEKNSYNPTLRPWYIASLKSDKIIKTQPYEFSNIPAKGITYAKEIEKSKNVVAIDVLVYDIQFIINNLINQDYMEAYLFNENGYIISSSKKENMLINNFIKLKHKLSEFKMPKIITINNEKYILQIIPLQGINSKDYVALFAKNSQAVAPYKKEVYIIIEYFLISLFIIIPLLIYFSNIIVKPIYKLVDASQKVKNREFNSIKIINSPVLEIALLSTSIKDMSNSIYSYQHSLEEKVKQRTKELILKNEELHILSITDKLTGLYNRVQLDKTLHIEVSKSLNSQNDFCIIIIDIDFFKRVNDNYGHQIGDDVLVETANTLKNSIRKSDILGRWGGEEFLIICPQLKIEDAVIIGNKLKEAVEKHNFSTYPKNVTISLGLADFYKGITKSEEILANADKALYEAKTNGRNQVKIFQNN
ncbi:diguanylate cyclase [Arcobacter sp.]|uniref:GGDEF domain-containing protein n=1 Tax=Arcobacter sp. TaxID=1872629 RepID=UPI003C737FA8